MNQTELVMRRRNVREFIAADSVQIRFVRQGAHEISEAGGKLPAETRTLKNQKARIVLNKRRYTNGIVNSEAGEIPHTDYVLIGNHKLDVEVEDSFVWLGEHYKITGRYLARTESVLCSIDLLGQPNGQ